MVGSDLLDDKLEANVGYEPAPEEVANAAAEVKAGYIADYISGQQVRATPEEVEAVQIFAKRLVQNYGYSKSQIQTRPQFRVRKSPSDEEKSYPVDIAVFNSDQKAELLGEAAGTPSLIVEREEENGRLTEARDVF